MPLTEEKDLRKYHEKVQHETVPTHDWLKMIGDSNAKFGTEYFLAQVAKRHTLHRDKTENGTMLC